MSKGFKIIYIVLFFLVCCLPMALMPFVKNNAEIEKRELAEFPKYMEHGRLNVDFSTQFESWLNDRIPYRAELLSTANLLKSEMLHAPSSNVIVGQEGWLFYETESMDYMDTNAMSDWNIKAAATTVSLLEKGVEAKGGKFTFVPMPNKASVYGEKMPKCYNEADENNLSRLTEALRDEHVNFVDMKGELTAHKDEGLLYHRRDSHWNYRGALLGYNLIMDSLGKEHETYADAPYTVEETWRGDLDKLLYPAGGFMDDQVNYDIQMPRFMFTSPASTSSPQEQLENFMSDKEQGDDQFQSKNMEKKDGSSLYMVRDSFGRALLPYFIANYETAQFKRTDCPDVATLAENTDVVYEIVERNLSRIVRKTPFMYAPEQEVIPAGQLSEGADIRNQVTGYGTYIFGSLPDDLSTDYVHVYVTLEKDGEKHHFEAFPIYDADLMGDKDPSNDLAYLEKKGFSAVISPESGLTGSWNVTVLADGRLFTGGTVSFGD